MSLSREVLLSSHAHDDAHQILQSPISVLLGVGVDAAGALRSLQIQSVFDLATSRIFANARRVVDATLSPASLFSQFGAVTSDVIDESLRDVAVQELPAQSIEALEGIGPVNGPSIRAALHVDTIRDLAFWPPYRNAVDLMTEALTPEHAPSFDLEAPADLLPKSGTFPTEKVFFSTIVSDRFPVAPTGEILQPIDVTVLAGENVGFTEVATGAVLTFEQSWYAVGVALGSLLHSVALAPGESTRIAMLDWSRKTRGTQDASTDQTERLENATEHNRVLSEVTEAVAMEAQGGFSSTTSVAESHNSGMAGGGVPIPAPLLFGASAGNSQNFTNAASTSASTGRRDLFASMTQSVQDATQQTASSSRSRRASVVREVSEMESERVTTRIVTNYNHMHALSIQYYEVVQIYRTVTRLSKVDKCLFVPMKVVNAWTRDMIERHRLALWAGALSPRVRRTLGSSNDLVEMTFSFDGTYNAPGPDYDTELDTARAVSGGFVSTDVLMPWFLPDQTQLTGISGGSGNAGSADFTGYRITFTDREAVDFDSVPGSSGGFSLSPSVSISSIAEIYVKISEATKEAIVARNDQYATIEAQHFGKTVSLEFQLGGETMVSRYPALIHDGDIIEESGTYLIRIARFVYGVPNYTWLRTHLEQNKYHYSQWIWRSLNSSELALLLSPYAYSGSPLLQRIDQRPIGIDGNYLIFRMHADENDKDWAEWLNEHGYHDNNPTRHETVLRAESSRWR